VACYELTAQQSFEIRRGDDVRLTRHGRTAMRPSERVHTSVDLRFMNVPRIQTINIPHLRTNPQAQAVGFIALWSGSDAYDRFGCAGLGAEQCLPSELTQRRRRARAIIGA